MIVELNSSYFNKYKNQIVLLLKGIQFISDEFAEKICKEVQNDLNLFSGYSFLYIENDVISGMILASPAGNHVFNKNTCEINYLSVNSGFWGKDVASSLVNHLKLKCSKSFDYLYLTVYENNKRAIEFYKKMGFYCYILNNVPQIVLRDAGTSIEHTDICMICNLRGI